MRLLAVALVLCAPCVVHAQTTIASVSEIRARAAARGWTSYTAPGASTEQWCASPPCDGDRYELTLATDGTLTLLRFVLRDAADGYAIDATAQGSGSFGFRFTRDDDVLDLSWERTYEPPGLTVGFSDHGLDEVVTLDPSDGSHAFALWIARELARYLESASSLLHTALARRRGLRASVASGMQRSATVRLGSFADCTEERSFPDGSSGMFEVCPYRMASEEEQRVALAALDARLDREAATLHAHHRAFHRVIVEALASTSSP